MATTTRTIQETLRDIVNKAVDGAGETPNSLDTDALDEMVYKYIIGPAQTYPFELVATNLYRWRGSKHLFLFAPTFTGQGGVDYTIYPSSTIKVRTGTHSGSMIEVTGSPCRFYALAAELCMFLASQAAQVGSMSMGGSSVAMTSVSTELTRLASYYSQMDDLHGV